ncbi:hypothetical protein ACLB2K_016811 [Fragaria x ananassa]
MFFQSETHCTNSQHLSIQAALEFPNIECFDRVDRAGGLALLWDDSSRVSVRDVTNGGVRTFGERTMKIYRLLRAPRYGNSGCQKIKDSGKSLLDWDRVVFKGRRKELEEVRRSLHILLQKPHDDNDRNEKLQLSQRLNELMTIDEVYRGQRSQAIWLKDKDGYHNSKVLSQKCIQQKEEKEAERISLRGKNRILKLKIQSYSQSNLELLKSDSFGSVLYGGGLSALISSSVGKGQWKGLQVCDGAPMISHLFFADDNMLYFQASSRDCQIIRNILNVYEAASGRQVNLQKSSVVFSGSVLPHLQQSYAAELGLQGENLLPFRSPRFNSLGVTLESRSMECEFASGGGPGQLGSKGPTLFLIFLFSSPLSSLLARNTPASSAVVRPPQTAVPVPNGRPSTQLSSWTGESYPSAVVREADLPKAPTVHWSPVVGTFSSGCHHW